jgi:GcrA cell cycle regulator
MTDTYTRGCHHSGWTQDREDLLKKLHGEGLSASQIATRITVTGFEVTRNAVIGKANRMGLTGGDKPRRSSRSARKRKPKSGNSINMVFGASRKSAKLFLTAEPFTPGPELVIPEHERKTLLQLEDNDCRWGIGDPKEKDFHFCGKAKVPGLVYCEHHARRAYQPPIKYKSDILSQVGRPVRVPKYEMTRSVDDLQSGDAPINTREKADA